MPVFCITIFSSISTLLSCVWRVTAIAKRNSWNLEGPQRSEIIKSVEYIMWYSIQIFRRLLSRYKLILMIIIICVFVSNWADITRARISWKTEGGLGAYHARNHEGFIFLIRMREMYRNASQFAYRNRKKYFSHSRKWYAFGTHTPAHSVGRCEHINSLESEIFRARGLNNIQYFFSRLNGLGRNRYFAFIWYFVVICTL